MLFNKFSFQILRSYSDVNGRFIICDIESKGKYITLATLYAPNEDNPIFFQNFFNHLRDFQCDEVMIGGDFNLVLDIDKDKKGGRYRTHLKSAKLLKETSADLDLVDVWRALNPDTRRYTWRRHKPEIHRRLDFFLVSQSLMSNIKRADISFGFKTDHSLISVSLATHSNQRGPGYWKLNTSLLSDNDYVNKIRMTVKNVNGEYSYDASVNPALNWEMIKLKIREQSIQCAKKKKKTKLQRKRKN